MKHFDLWSEEQEADNLSEIMDHEHSLSQKLKTDLLNVVTLFHKNLTNWYNLSGNELFKIQVNRFLTNYIIKTISKSPSNHTTHLAKQNVNNKSLYNEQQCLNRMQKNRDVHFVKLCKQIFEYVKEHENVVGGFIQARIRSSDSCTKSTVMSFVIHY